MSKVIWKFPILKMLEEFELDIPKGAEILTVQMQSGRAQLWALVESQQSTEKRTFFVCGTGQEVHPSIADGRGHYIGTFQEEGGALIWHFFETNWVPF